MSVAVAPRLVHKESTDDVLLADYQPAVPFTLPKELPLNSALREAYIEGKDGLLRFNLYSSHGGRAPGALDFTPNNFAPEWPCATRGVPCQIAFPSIEAGRLCGDEFFSLLESTCKQLDLPRSSSYSLINDGAHFYFYRKAHEHVPGMMLLEAHRQAVYHHLYQTSGHARGNVTVSLAEVTARFFSHAELMYPIELVIDSIYSSASLRPRSIIYRSSFYQKRALIAMMDTKASVIGLDRFEKLRNVFNYHRDSFVPIRSGAVKCELRSKDGKAVSTPLLEIDKHGCVTSGSHPGCVSISVSNHEGIHFTADISEIGRTEHGVRWKFDTMNEQSLIALSQLIKRCFVVPRQTQ